MRFWDSSAIVPLILGESASARMRELHRSDRDMLVWWGTLVECHSGLARRERATQIGSGIRSQAGEALNELSLHWNEVEPVAGIRQVAIRLLAAHDLRAADALQLAAAIASRNEQQKPVEFVCLDRRLAEAAAKEGFPVTGEVVS